MSDLKNIVEDFRKNIASVNSDKTIEGYFDFLIETIEKDINNNLKTWEFQGLQEHFVKFIGNINSIFD